MSYENMTDQEIAEALAELQAVRDLREQLERAEEDKARIAAQVDDLLMQLQQLNGVQAGGEWVPPVSASGAYPLGAVVTHKGHTWENIVASNPHEPGVSGWAIAPEVGEDGEDVPPPYVQPAGAHDAYRELQRITWEDGKVYEAVRDGVVHTPGQDSSEWRLYVAPEPEPTPEPEPEPEEEPEAPPEESDEPEPEVAAPWAQPAGGHDAYMAGARVTHESQTWISTVDNNAWAPGIFGWTVEDA